MTYAGPTSSGQCLIGTNVDVQRIGGGASAAFISGHIGLAIVVGRYARTDVDNVDNDALSHSANRSTYAVSILPNESGGIHTAVASIVRYFIASAAVAGRTRGTLIARHGVLAVTFAFIDGGIAQTPTDIG